MNDINSFDAAASTDGHARTADAMKPVVTVSHLANAIVLTVAGEIDMLTAPELENAVQQALAEHPATLVMDLTGVQFLSSAGIAVIMFAERHETDTILRLVATDRIVLRPLELTGLADDLAIHRTLQSALGLQPTEVVHE